jgi:hypothetical protein
VVQVIGLSLDCCLDPRQVVKTVTHGMIFENKLARQSSIAVKRNWSGTIKLLVG